MDRVLGSDLDREVISGYFIYNHKINVSKDCPAMKPTQQFTLASAFFFSIAGIDAHAALYDRGNGMIYDSAQNITWLQDANYAKTSGYDADGQMSWAQATTWATTLNYDGHSGWRLPSANLTGRSWFTYDGTSDIGYNITTSEMGGLYYGLGNNAYCVQGNMGGVCGQSDYGFKNTSFMDTNSHQNVSFSSIFLSTSSLFTAYFWYAEEGAGWYGEHGEYLARAYYFSATYGDQATIGTQNFASAWAVHDGDIANVSSIPVPAAAWLFGSGLVGLVGAARRKAS